MLEHYSVERVGGNDAPQAATFVHVSASSALQAGELALGTRLSLTGRAESLRAIVWHLTDSFTAISVRLFECSQLTASSAQVLAIDKPAGGSGPVIP
jgi:hypothetical protein